MDERGNTEMMRVSACDLIPNFMSFVSLDCTYTGSKNDHSGTQILFYFLLPVCIYISMQYILTNVMLIRVSATEKLVCLFNGKCGNVISKIVSSDVLFPNVPATSLF